jgi:hypothetical protein
VHCCHSFWSKGPPPRWSEDRVWSNIMAFSEFSQMLQRCLTEWMLFRAFFCGPGSKNLSDLS